MGTWMPVFMVTYHLLGTTSYGEKPLSKAISLSSRIVSFSWENGQSKVNNTEILAMTGYLGH